MKKSKLSKKTKLKQAQTSKILYAYVIFTAAILGGAIVLQSSFHRTQITEKHRQTFAPNPPANTEKPESRQKQEPRLSHHSIPEQQPTNPEQHATTPAIALNSPAPSAENNLNTIPVDKSLRITPPNLTPNAPYISIIIDDIGYQYQPGQRAIDMPGELTLAFIPHSPYAAKLASIANSQGKETMLHAPMEPSGEVNWGKGLDQTMERVAIKQSLLDMFAALPEVKGVNNHMGSALTEHREVMNWVMEELTDRDLYFVDSLTTPNSQAGLSAKAHNIPTYSRDIFLDNIPSDEEITRQFHRLIRLAKARGYALGIGHPYPETLAVLERELANLEQLDVELVPVSTLIELIYHTEGMYASNVHINDYPQTDTQKLEKAGSQKKPSPHKKQPNTSKLAYKG